MLVYLRDGTSGVPPTALGKGAVSEDLRTRQWREVGLGAQILRDLGVHSIRLLASRERHYVGMEGFGIRIARTEIL